MFDLKRIALIVAAGAATGLTGAVAVDWAEFRKFLDAKDYDGLWSHIRLFDFRAALPRYWRGIYGGAFGALIGALGLDVFGAGA